MVTLLHFTHPLWLEDRGGFESDEAPAAFLAFARRVYREFGGKVGCGSRQAERRTVARILYFCCSFFVPCWLGRRVLHASQRSSFLSLCISKAQNRFGRPSSLGPDRCFGKRVSKQKGDDSMSSTVMILRACNLPRAIESCVGAAAGFVAAWLHLVLAFCTIS